MSNPIKKLHSDIKNLHAAQKKHETDAKSLRSDKKDESRAEKQLKRDKDQFTKSGKALTGDQKLLGNDKQQEQVQLGAINAVKASVQQQYEASVDPTTGQGDATLQALLGELDSMATSTKASFDPKITADQSKVAADKKARTQDKTAEGKDKKAITHEKKLVSRETKTVSKDASRVKSDRSRALNDLKPAEYKMGLKQTNELRKQLGLKSVSKVVRPAGPENVTPTMRALARDAVKVADSMGGHTSLGLCATGVCRTVQDAMGFYPGGNGNTIGNGLLASGKFKQIHISLAQALKIPGLILSWQHTSTPEGRIYGHTAVTLGDGKQSASDFIEYDTLTAAQSRSGLKIYMPIK